LTRHRLTLTIGSTKSFISLPVLVTLSGAAQSSDDPQVVASMASRLWGKIDD
jgi:hypothetical protein